MDQVLFRIPLPSFFPWLDSIPVYGFGVMLVVALFVCTWLASWRAQKEGIPKERIQDLALWIVIAGIVGARLVYMIQYHQPLSEFLLLWQGGLVFYGSLVGGIIGYALAYVFVLRKHNLSWRKVADVIAPAAALGLCIGRVGCLLNGCCYGDVACPDCRGISFPLPAPVRYELVGKGFQTAAGFSVVGSTWRERNDLPRIEDRPRPIVASVDPESPIGKSGVKAGDVILELNGQPVRDVNALNRALVQAGKNRDPVVMKVQRGQEELTCTCDPPAGQGFTLRSDCTVTAVDPDSAAAKVGLLMPGDTIVGMRQGGEMREVERYADLIEREPDGRLVVKEEGLDTRLTADWPRGQNQMTLLVERGGKKIELPSFKPETLAVYPTQVYESISMGLLFLVLLAYTPLRRHDGEVFALFLVAYAVHRFLNEMLRNDTAPVALGMTLSQNGSILVLLAAIAFWIWLWRQPVEYPAVKKPQTA